MKRLIVGGLAVSVVGLAGCGGEGGTGDVPTFVVDALWPQPLAYPYILGPVSGVTVAPDGNILIVTRQDGFSQINEINSVTGTGQCCTPTQAVLEYQPDGSLVRQWGGPDMGYPWPVRPHGIGIDPDGNIWIGGGVAPPAGGGRFGRGGRGGRGGNAGPPPEPAYDTHILKFSRTGEHLMTIGEVGGTPSSMSQNSFGGVADFAFDAGANEVYVADGYANHRVAVLDVSTGEIKRSWGAYGNEPSDAAMEAYMPGGTASQQFATVSCVALVDDLVYVCDREHDRIQVFEKDGTFVTEATLAPETLGRGSVFDIAASPDEDFLYVADGMNERVHIVDRESLTNLTTFGVGGRYPSHFRELGSLAVDAAGDIFTAEDGQGRRVQKFVYTGLGPVTMENQGAVYPQGAQ
jgi:DNA-binding beta-propeller fold protein YncE